MNFVHLVGIFSVLVASGKPVFKGCRLGIWANLPIEAPPLREIYPKSSGYGQGSYFVGYQDIIWSILKLPMI